MGLICKNIYSHYFVHKHTLSLEKYQGDPLMSSVTCNNINKSYFLLSTGSVPRDQAEHYAYISSLPFFLLVRPVGGGCHPHSADEETKAQRLS
jgi:hypothetical protein